MDMPVPFDLFEALIVPGQLFQFDLFTNDAADNVYDGMGQFNLCSDPAYAAQQTTAQTAVMTDEYVVLEFGGVEFSSEDFTTSQSIWGYQVSLVYDNAIVPVSQNWFDQAVLMGPDSQFISVGPTIECHDVEEAVAINWG